MPLKSLLRTQSQPGQNAGGIRAVVIVVSGPDRYPFDEEDLWQGDLLGADVQTPTVRSQEPCRESGQASKLDRIHPSRVRSQEPVSG